MDTNADGRTTFAEFKAFCSKKRDEDHVMTVLEEETLASLREIFKQLDADGSGGIKQAEFVRAFRSQRDIIVRVSACKELRCLLKPAAWKRVFKEMDLDKSGEVTLAELALFVFRERNKGTAKKEKTGLPPSPSLSRAATASNTNTESAVRAEDDRNKDDIVPLQKQQPSTQENKKGSKSGPSREDRRTDTTYEAKARVRRTVAKTRSLARTKKLGRATSAPRSRDTLQRTLNSLVDETSQHASSTSSCLNSFATKKTGPSEIRHEEASDMLDETTGSEPNGGERDSNTQRRVDPGATPPSGAVALGDNAWTRTNDVKQLRRYTLSLQERLSRLSSENENYEVLVADLRSKLKASKRRAVLSKVRATRAASRLAETRASLGLLRKDLANHGIELVTQDVSFASSSSRRDGAIREYPRRSPVNQRARRPRTSGGTRRCRRRRRHRGSGRGGRSRGLRSRPHSAMILPRLQGSASQGTMNVAGTFSRRPRTSEESRRSRTQQPFQQPSPGTGTKRSNQWAEEDQGATGELEGIGSEQKIEEAAHRGQGITGPKPRVMSAKSVESKTRDPPHVLPSGVRSFLHHYPCLSREGFIEILQTTPCLRYDTRTNTMHLNFQNRWSKCSSTNEKNSDDLLEELSSALIRFSAHRITRSQDAVLQMSQEEMQAHFRSGARPLCNFTLDLSGNGLTDRGVEALAHAVRRNRGILSIDLRSNVIGEDGVRHLARAVRSRAAIAGVVVGVPYVHSILLQGNPKLTRDFTAQAFGLTNAKISAVFASSSSSSSSCSSSSSSAAALPSSSSSSSSSRYGISGLEPSTAIINVNKAPDIDGEEEKEQDHPYAGAVYANVLSALQA